MASAEQLGSGIMNPVFDFSNDTRQLLLAAGWTEDRAIDVSGYERDLRREGYELLHSAAEFLGSFGGLVLEARLKPGVKATHHFDPSQAAENVDPGWVLGEYRERIGAPLCPIGMSDNCMVLMMDPAGAVYAGFDEALVKLGGSGEDAIETLCTNRKSEKIP